MGSTTSVKKTPCSNIYNIRKDRQGHTYITTYKSIEYHRYNTICDQLLLLKRLLALLDKT